MLGCQLGGCTAARWVPRPRAGEHGRAPLTSSSCAPPPPRSTPSVAPYRAARREGGGWAAQGRQSRGPGDRWRIPCRRRPGRWGASLRAACKGAAYERPVVAVGAPGCPRDAAPSPSAAAQVGADGVAGDAAPPASPTLAQVFEQRWRKAYAVRALEHERHTRSQVRATSARRAARGCQPLTPPPPPPTRAAHQPAQQRRPGAAPCSIARGGGSARRRGRRGRGSAQHAACQRVGTHIARQARGAAGLQCPPLMAGTPWLASAGAAAGDQAARGGG